MSKEPKNQDDRIRAQRAALAARHATYRQLLKLGKRRTDLERSLEDNTEKILQVIRTARPNLKIGEAADAAGVSRQTLYRWLNLNP